MLNFKIPNFNTQFTGNEAMEMMPNKLPMMNEHMTQGQEPSAPFNLSEDSVDQVSELFSSQDKMNSTFAERNKNIVKQMGITSKISDTLSSAAMKSGNPIAMAAGAVMKVGSAVGKSSRDEFGVVKDKGKAIVGGILNPIDGVSTLLGQNDRKEAKNRFVNTELASKRAETQVAGNRITNSIPRYNPPSYGRFGLKIKRF